MQPREERWTGSASPRTVLITGGSTGIGRAVGAAFARTGDRVILVSRSEERLRAAATEIGPNAQWRVADLGRKEDIMAMAEAVVREHGRVDVLVNAAAATTSGGRITTTLSVDEAEQLWDTEVDVGLKGAFLVTIAVAPHLSRPGGRIINISSIAAFTGGSRPGSLAYAATKAGILGLTYALARELSPMGITVNAIAPGFIAGTGLTAAWPTDRAQGIVAQTPVGRAGSPNDVAAAALFLASPEASFVTGEVLNVNGGWLFGH